MSFKATDVAELRNRTGAGMMDCKKALTHTNGDMEKAAEYLRRKNRRYGGNKLRIRLCFRIGNFR